jgi:hypothetical protein
MCGKEFKPNSPTQLYCKECGIIIRKENAKQYNKQYRLEHPEYNKQYNKQWQKDNLEYFRQYNKQWRKENPELRKEYQKQYHLKHKAEILEKHKQYKKAHPELEKMIRRRSNFKRRDLGFIPLNDYFEGSVGHHKQDRIMVIYVPEWLHKSIWHNNNTGQGMKEIDTLAEEFLLIGE